MGSTITEEKKEESSSNDSVLWSTKPTRVYESNHFDSGCWEVVDRRDDDIVIATAYKSGTTWVQTIVAHILFDGGDNLPGGASVGELSPWVDLRIPPRPVTARICNNQQHRRFLKTHLTTDALGYDPNTKYVYVARDGRDAFMSLYNHYKKANEKWYGALNESPGLVGDPMPRFSELFPDDGVDENNNVRELFDLWLSKPWGTYPWEEDGWPFWSLFTNFKSWWKVRSLPNVLLVHYNDLKSDLPNQIRRIATFLNNDKEKDTISDEKIQQYAKACTFDEMKQNAEKYAPLNGVLWSGGATSFIHKGTNGRWKDILTSEQNTKYEALSIKKLGDEASKWLAEGGTTD